MNWYRFKIELIGVLWKTFMCVFMVVTYRQTLVLGGQSFLMVPAEIGFLAYHQWLLPVGMWLLIAVLWLCYFQTFRIFRSNRRYGER